MSETQSMTLAQASAADGVRLTSALLRALAVLESAYPTVKWPDRFAARGVIGTVKKPTVEGVGRGNAPKAERKPKPRTAGSALAVEATGSVQGGVLLLDLAIHADACDAEAVASGFTRGLAKWATPLTFTTTVTGKRRAAKAAQAVEPESMKLRLAEVAALVGPVIAAALGDGLFLGASRVKRSQDNRRIAKLLLLGADGELQVVASCTAAMEKRLREAHTLAVEGEPITLVIDGLVFQCEALTATVADLKAARQEQADDEEMDEADVA
jgi:hypothetical protein